MILYNFPLKLLHHTTTTTTSKFHSKRASSTERAPRDSRQSRSKNPAQFRKKIRARKRERERERKATLARNPPTCTARHTYTHTGDIYTRRRVRRIIRARVFLTRSFGKSAAKHTRARNATMRRTREIGRKSPGDVRHYLET